MKGWLQTLCLSALLAGRVLANEVELVRSCCCRIVIAVKCLTLLLNRNKMKPTVSDARGCTVARHGEETWTRLYWPGFRKTLKLVKAIRWLAW